MLLNFLLHPLKMSSIAVSPSRTFRVAQALIPLLLLFHSTRIASQPETISPRTHRESRLRPSEVGPGVQGLPRFNRWLHEPPGESHLLLEMRNVLPSGHRTVGRSPCSRLWEMKG